MPELPDVETFRRTLARTSLHRPIGRVDVCDQTLLRGTSPRTLRQRLTGEVLERTRRRGKFLFVATSGSSSLVLHFGMTGHLTAGDAADELPAHTRVVLGFEDGRRLVFVDQRRLGTVTTTEDVDSFCDGHDLGPDALELSERELRALCAETRGGVKTLLMDQSRMAGVGNIYSDEICFAARIDPRRSASGLDRNEIARLHHQLRRVLELAIDRRADPERLPRGWLIHRREEGATCPRCGGEVRRFKAGGRGAYRCTHCQS